MPTLERQTPMHTLTCHCEICHEEIEAHRITKHLNSCIRRNVTNRPPDNEHDISTAPALDSVCHIRVRSEQPDDLYRLHLLARPDTTMEELDRAIRRAWGEPCCETDHDSAFEKSWAKFSSSPGDNDKTMDQTLAHLWDIKGTGPTYTFDHQLPFVCQIDQFGLWRAPGPHALHLLARNNPIQRACQNCAKPATRALTAFRPRAPSTKTSFRCDPCAAQTKGVWLPIVNSPRAGACTYGAKPTPE